MTQRASRCVVMRDLVFFLLHINMDYESGVSSWSQPCTWRSSWRGFAIKNVLLSTLTYLPLLFLIYCAIKYPKTFSVYKRVVYVPALCQCVGLLPMYIFLIWFSIFIDSDRPTSVFVCSITKTCLGIFAFSTFTSPVAISLCRYLIVVRNTPLTLSFLVFIILLFSIPSHLMNFVIMFTGRPQMGSPCTGLIAASLDVTRAYHSLMIITMALSFPFNYSVYRFVKGHADRRSRSSDEISVTLGLTLQGIAPFLGFSITVIYMSLLVSNVVIPYWANVFVDSIAYLIPGMNTVVSIMFIKSFKHHFRHLFRSHITELLVLTKSNTSTPQRSNQTY